MDKTVKKILIFFSIVLVFYLLKILSTILIPFVLALLLAILFHPLIINLEKIKLPRWLIIPVISAVTLLLFFVVINIILATSSQIVQQQDFFVERLKQKTSVLFDLVNYRFQSDFDFAYIAEEFREGFDVQILSQTAGELARVLRSFVASFVMFAIYYVIFLAGMSNYRFYLQHVGGEKDGYTLVENYEKIKKSVFSYIIIKSLISLLTAFCAGIILWLFGVKFVLFFAFLTFILNFIPNIGSTIATIPPVIMLFIQSDSINPVVVLLILLSAIQMSIGNVLEPVVMGNRLRLNTFTVLFGLVLWGFIWGIPGMMLSVPLMVITKLFLEQSDSTKIVARAMGYPEKQKREPSV